MTAVRFLLAGLAVLAGLLAAPPRAQAFSLFGDSTREWLVEKIEGAVESPDMHLKLGAIEGSIPTDFTFATATLADSQGVWLTIEKLHVVLSPSALLTRRAKIDALEAASITVTRAPVSTQPAAPAEPGQSVLPDLPVGIELDKLVVERLELGPALLGEPAVLRIGGSAKLERSGGALDAKLQVARIDDKPGQADVVALFDPEKNTLNLSITASEPAGGVMARALALPGLPPVDIVLKGDGTLDDWRGTLTAAAGDAGNPTGNLAADATIRKGPDGHALTLTAGGNIAPLLAGLAGETVVPLVGPSPALNATIVRSPSGAITVSPLALTAAAATATVSGDIAADFSRMALRWTVEAGPESTLHPLVPVSWREGVIEGSAEGALNALTVAVNATLRDLAGDDPALSRLTGPETVLTARAQVDTGSGSIGLQTLTLTAAAARASAEGRVGGWGQTADLTLSASADDLSALSGLAGRPLAGAVTLAGPVRRGADGTVTAELKGDAERLATGTPADGVLGDKASLSLAAQMEPNGAMRLTDLTVDGRNGRLIGTAALADNRVDARTNLTVTRLEPLGGALGTPMAGSATLEAAARGPLDAIEAQATLNARDLVVQGRRLGATEVKATAAGLPGTPNGTVAARTHLDNTPLTLDGRYALRDQELRLDGLSVANGNNRITGEAQVALDTLLATGRLEGSLPNLKGLSELAGVPLGGGAKFTLALDGKSGKQAASLNADASNLRVEGEGGPLLTAGRLAARAEVADALGVPSGRARLEMGDGSAAGNPLRSVTASAEGSLSKATFQANVAGAGDRPIGLDLAGNLAQESAATRIRLERLQARYAGEDLRMTGPATVLLAERRYEVQGLRLSSGNARLAADLGLNGERLNGEVTVDRLPLALAKLASPTLLLDGVANARATLGGTVRNPRADATLRVSGLKAQQTTRAGLPGIDATVDAQWRDRRLVVNGRVGMPRNAGVLTANAALPLVMNPDNYAVGVPPNGAVEAAVNGTLDLSLANDLLASSGDRARGTLRLDVRAGGTVAKPSLGGSVTLAGGRYENRASGAVITDIEARLVGDGDVFTIQSFRGRTRNGGAISASGVIRPAAAADQQLDIALKADNARLAEIDLATAEVGADLRLTGGFTNARLAGPVVIRRAEIQIPNRMPANIATLEVKEVGKGRPRGTTQVATANGTRQAPRPDAAEAPPSPFVLALDMTVNAPNQIFVRGRGVDAELGGNLKIAGTANAPAVTGRFSILKGSLNLLAHDFEFKRGIFDFDGTTPIDPRLDLLAEATANGITADVVVSGTSRRPKIELTSPQGLPQDEVLAGVLFGKSVGDLSAGEAVQLAQSAAALAGFGGGGGILDKVRRGLGVDRLDFTAGENGKGGAVQAGRYVSDRVYVGVEQGIGANQTRAKVEVDITKSIKGQATVGANSETQFGVTFERDY
ncbi:translocation/assembly module TamB domain-containing protein [Azospirillum picis]|uniref:Translocation and assembly module TamB n=1 Tax=Azospirillum picis TaxID=488438 RepID=A0ABU0MTP5_9PROT|nr:translocation/assembly module TamB domain-containing protein [Azospirillum picis]MBP2303110.1 translocation and assembly module TamB [Azospirillum picis]MDQ0536862.1 translocation and assembly module TamB [Azospirillum picis]